MTVLGVMIQVIVLRPLIGEPVISIIMVTVGLSIFFQSIMKWAFGIAPQGFPQVFEAQTMLIFGLPVETAYVGSLIVAIIGMLGFAWLFKFSKIGLAMRATAFNQQVAQSLGVSVRQVFALSWAISAVVSGLAGIVVGLVNGVSAQLSVYGIKVFPAVILGGLDSILGAVIGGIVIGLLENTAEFVDGQYLHFGNLYVVAPFYVLVAILVIKPYGLFGTHDIERI
jgi:branched-chain amino acid transport system permease protein